MTRQEWEQLRWENLRTEKGKHQILKGMLPFFAMRLYPPAISFEGLQMSNLVYEGDQEPVRVAHGIDRDLMAAIRQGPVITKPRYAFIYNPEMHPGIPYKGSIPP